jgi:hypothetical protein
MFCGLELLGALRPLFRLHILAKKIEKLQRDFFWNDGVAKKKVHVVD